MATVTATSVATSIATLFDPEVRTLFNRKAALASLLPATATDGQNVTWTVEAVDGRVSSSSSYLADGADPSVFNSDGKQAATLEPAIMSEAFAVTPFAIAKAQASGSPADLSHLVEHELMGAVTRLFSNLNRELFLGAGTANTVAGLAVALAATGTYAGISHSAIAGWTGNQLANGGTARALTLVLMDAAITAAEIASGKRPSYIVCSVAKRDAIATLVRATGIQNVVSTSQDQMITMNGGYSGVNYSGLPVIADFNCPDGVIYFVCAEDTKLRQLLPPTEEAASFADMKMPNGLVIRILELANTGGARKFQARMYVQLQVKCPNSGAMLSDLL